MSVTDIVFYSSYLRSCSQGDGACADNQARLATRGGSTVVVGGSVDSRGCEVLACSCITGYPWILARHCKKYTVCK